VVAFGLYHGLVFLPVVLSICGPDPYYSAVIIEELPEHEVALTLNLSSGDKVMIDEAD